MLTKEQRQKLREYYKNPAQEGRSRRRGQKAVEQNYSDAVKARLLECLDDLDAKDDEIERLLDSCGYW